MIDFSAIGLRRTGLDRGNVIDCDSSDYPLTQALGAWAYANTVAADPLKAVHGIVWTSREDHSGQAAILFGDRLPHEVLEARDADRSLDVGHVTQR